MLDLESTRYCLANVPGCREGNAFAPKGTLGQHALLLPLGAFTGYSAFRQKQSGSRLWWLSETIQSGLHAFAGVHNIGVIRAR